MLEELALVVDTDLEALPDPPSTRNCSQSAHPASTTFIDRCGILCLRIAIVPERVEYWIPGFLHLPMVFAK
jgi:hypothetical protein